MNSTPKQPRKYKKYHPVKTVSSYDPHLKQQQSTEKPTICNIYSLTYCGCSSTGNRHAKERPHFKTMVSIGRYHPANTGRSFKYERCYEQAYL